MRKIKGPCKYLYDEVCCNDSSDFLADFPAKEDCAKCPLYDEKVTKEGVKRVKVTK